MLPVPTSASAAERWLLLALAVGASALVATVQHHGFFWDNVLLASRYGQWYYDTQFQTPFVPADIAVGYPTAFAWGLALGWRLLEPSLAVSHWLMLPFLLGTIWQAWRLTRRFVPSAQVAPALVLVLLDPTWLAQAALVTPDLPLLFLYLFALNAQLDHRPGQLAVVLPLLVLVSGRGTLAAAALLATDLLNFLLLPAATWPQKPLGWLKRWWPYVPMALAIGGWMGLHYHHYGWVGYHESGPWAAGSQPNDFKGVLRNVALIGWRVLDQGRGALWLAAVVLAWSHVRRGRGAVVSTQLTVLVLVPLAVLSAVLLLRTNPIGQRYFLPVYLLLAVWVAHHLAAVGAGRRRAVYVLLAGSLLSGHFWNGWYPEKIAKGWDSSLAFLPYFSLRDQMLGYLTQHRIPLAAVGSDYPNAYALCYADLRRGDTRQFAPKDLSTNCYVLQSNAMNGFLDHELTALTTHWHLLREVRAGQLYFRLYQNPTPRRCSAGRQQRGATNGSGSVGMGRAGWVPNPYLRNYLVMGQANLRSTSFIRR